MTDISVIKMIISVAVWRIYPSWVNDKLRAWEGLGHSGMFWARLLKDDFRLKLEIISFLSRVSPFRRVFLFPALLKDLAPNFQALNLLVSTMSWRSFWKLRSVTGCFFSNSNYDDEYFVKISFLFSKEGALLLAWQMGDPQAEQSTLVVVRRKLEWKLDFRAWARSSAEGPSIIVAIGTSRVRWSTVQKRKKHKEVSVWLCEGSALHRLQTIEFWGACFRDPMSLPWRRYRFAPRCFRGRGCSAARRSGYKYKERKAKKSSHPWHFRCWSLRRNDRTWVHRSRWLDRGNALFFVTWCNYRCWFCVGKALWRWFYPRSRKRDHFQTLATRVPKLKTWLGTQRVN